METKEIIGGKPPKQIEPFDNVMRHVLAGKFPNGFVQGNLKMYIQKNKLKIQITSFDDDSVLKEWERSYNLGDTIHFVELKVAYGLEFTKR